MWEKRAFQVVLLLFLSFEGCFANPATEASRKDVMEAIHNIQVGHTDFKSFAEDFATIYYTVVGFLSPVTFVRDNTTTAIARGTQNGEAASISQTIGTLGYPLLMAVAAAMSLLQSRRLDVWAVLTVLLVVAMLLFAAVPEMLQTTKLGNMVKMLAALQLLLMLLSMHYSQPETPETDGEDTDRDVEFDQSPEDGKTPHLLPAPNPKYFPGKATDPSATIVMAELMAALSHVAYVTPDKDASVSHEDKIARHVRALVPAVTIVDGSVKARAYEKGRIFMFSIKFKIPEPIHVGTETKCAFVFRGTANLHNVMADLGATIVGKGTNKARTWDILVGAMSKDIMEKALAEALKDIQSDGTEDGCPAGIYFTGHSMGGAFASLAAIRAKEVLYPAELPKLREQLVSRPHGTIPKAPHVIYVYTFGEPRSITISMDPSAYSNIEKHRFLNDGDPAPFCPPHAVGGTLRHWGVVHYLIRASPDPRDHRMLVTDGTTREGLINHDFYGARSFFSCSIRCHKTGTYLRTLDRVRMAIPATRAIPFDVAAIERLRAE